MQTKLRAEQWLYLLFVVSLPFATVLELAGYSGSIQIADVLLLAAGLVWFVLWLARKRRVIWSRFYILLAAYAVAVTLSTVFSVRPEQSVVKLVGKFYLIGIAFLTVNIVNSGFVLKRMLQGWLVGAGIVLTLSLLGIGLFYAGWNDPKLNLVLHPIFGSLPPGNYPRIEGFFLYPAMLCNFLGVTWMFAIALSSVGWLRARLFWIFGAVLLVVNAFTLTPGLGGIFLSTSLFLRERFIKSGSGAASRFVLASGLFAGAVFLFAATFTLFSYDKNGSRVPLASGEISPSHRAAAWSTAFQTFLKHPILGNGIDTPIANSEFIDPSGNRQLLTDAHNTFISVLGETGLVGFLAYLSIIGFVAFSLARWKPAHDLQKMIRLCLLLAMIDAFFYQSLTGSYEDTRHLWAFFGIAVAASNIDLGSPTKSGLGVSL